MRPAAGIPWPPPLQTTFARQGSSQTGLVTRESSIDQETIDNFVALAGGTAANIVYIPTAEEDAKITATNGSVGEFCGLQATVLHTRDRIEANLDSFVDPIRKATGVFIDGGRQPRLAETYLNTKTQQELASLLDRGGVIAGTSAGATILGSFLVRNQGAPAYVPDLIVDPGYPTEGFGFIKNIAIDQHISVRGREIELVGVVNSHPGLLGIGIDEDTAVLVQSNKITIIGSGNVYVHDGTYPLYTMGRGKSFDLPSRRAV